MSLILFYRRIYKKILKCLSDLSNPQNVQDTANTVNSFTVVKFENGR